MAITKEMEAKLNREMVRIVRENINVTKEFLLKDELLRLGVNNLTNQEIDEKALLKLAEGVINKDKIVEDIMTVIEMEVREPMDQINLIDIAMESIDNIIANEMIKQATPLMLSLGKE